MSDDTTYAVTHTAIQPSLAVDEKADLDKKPISYALILKLAAIREYLTKERLKLAIYYLISFFNSSGNGLAYFSLLMLLHLHLPFLLIFTVSLLAIGLVTHKFYFKDIKEGNKELFETQFSDLSKKQKIMLGALFPFAISAAVSTAVFSYIYIVPALLSFFTFCGIACPPIALIVVGAILAVFVGLVIMYAMICQAKKLVQKEWFLEKINFVKALWQVDNELSTPRKIWEYIKATLITLSFAAGIGLAVYAVVHSYGGHWVKAVELAGHSIAKHWAQCKESIISILSNVCVYVFALPIKLFFNADYTAMLFYSLSYKFLNLNQININLSNLKEKATAEIKHQYHAWREHPGSQLLKCVKAAGVLLWKCVKLISGLINVVAKMMLGKGDMLAEGSTAGYEGAKAFKMATGVSLNEVKPTTFFGKPKTAANEAHIAHAQQENGR